MSKKKNRGFSPRYFGGNPPSPSKNIQQKDRRTVASLLDEMVDGKEYGSIVSLRPESGNLIPELQRAIGQLESVRARGCICYVANVIKDLEETAISASDHLPFSEVVEKVGNKDAVDVFLVTPGGFAEQVTLFVDALRSKFASVEFILPYKAMSAGTLWALSGERIWMDRRACIGPVDPQVYSSDNRLIPAQALLTLFNKIQIAGDEALRQKQNPPWAYIRLLDKMDQRQLGAALSSTQYIEDIATKYLCDYKFKTWTTHSTTGRPVTEEERQVRAREVAQIMCSHDKWKAHGHAITRDAAFAELKIKVDNIEDQPGLERAVRRLWALFYYIFDKSLTKKIIVSADYSYVRTQIITETAQKGV